MKRASPHGVHPAAEPLFLASGREKGSRRTKKTKPPIFPRRSFAPRARSPRHRNPTGHVKRVRCCPLVPPSHQNGGAACECDGGNEGGGGRLALPRMERHVSGNKSDNAWPRPRASGSRALVPSHPIPLIIPHSPKEGERIPKRRDAEGGGSPAGQQGWIALRIVCAGKDRRTILWLANNTGD